MINIRIATVAAFILSASQAFAALAVDTVNNNQLTTVSTIPVNVGGGSNETILANDVVVVRVAVGNLTGGSTITVSSVTDTASLVWHKRASQVITHAATQNVDLETWWACAGTSNLTNWAATVHLSGTADSGQASMVAVKGFTGTGSSPWDSVSVPSIATNSTAGAATTPGTTITTTNANTMLLGFFTATAGNTASGTGYTTLNDGLIQFSPGSTFEIAEAGQYKVVSTTQTGAADDLSGSGITSNYWIFIADALSQTGACTVASAVSGSLPAMGVGR